MRIESLLLLFLGAFFGAIGLWYWFWGYDDGGGVMLLGATLLGFLPGFYYFFWHQRFHGRNADRSRVRQRPDGRRIDSP